MFGYELYFILSIVFSAIFAIVGVGSSLALIPLFVSMGIDFVCAKALGLFANGVSTAFISYQNIKNNLVDIKFIAPIFFMTTISSSIGAYFSKFINQNLLETIFGFFILFSIYLMFRKEGSINIDNKTYNKTYLYIVSIFIALIAGSLGVGGGAIFLPLFIYIGISVKKSINMVSFLIPFISLSAFFTYITYIEIDLIILFLVGFGALIGGFLGNKISKSIKNEKYLKYLISILLIIMGIKMLSSIIKL